MRVSVLGAGAVGCLFAAQLAQAGHDVSLIARGEQALAITGAGLRLRGGYGQALVWPNVARTIEPSNLVVIAVKAHQLEPALIEHQRALARQRVMLVQNGVDALAIAGRMLPTSDLYGALCLTAVNVSAPGEITVTNPGPLLVGRGNGPVDRPSQLIADELAGAMSVRAIDNFTAATWSKLVINAGNALPAITGLPIQRLVRDHRLRQIWARAVSETALVARQAGIRLTGLDARQAEDFERLGTDSRYAQRFVRALARAMGPVPNYASTWQSLARGVETEIDFLSGAVARIAHDRGGSAPVNAALCALVHEREGGVAAINPRTVWRRLRPAMHRRPQGPTAERENAP